MRRSWPCGNSRGPRSSFLTRESLYSPGRESREKRQTRTSRERLSLQGNPAVKEDWWTNPKTGQQVDFTIESKGVTVPVVHTGDQPELFKPGIPVVLEGRFEQTVFASDRIMVKHSEDYIAKHPSRVTTSVP